MTKRTKTTDWQPEIDQTYESQVTALSAVEGHVSDYAGQYAIERPGPPPRNALVLPERPQQHAIVTAEETALISQSQQAVGQLMQWVNPNQPDTTHTRQTDTAVSVAVGSIVASIPMLLMFIPITAGLTILLWLIVGGGGGYWALGWLVAWGALGLYTLIRNREQGLYHSSTGIAHHALDNQAVEIEERYATARYAIHETFAFIERQRSLADERSNER